MRIIKFLSIAVLFASCEKDVTVKVPAHEPSLVINSVTETGDTIKIEVSKTTGILEKKGKAQLVQNATVSLYENDIFLQTLSLNPASGEYQSNTMAAPGKTYKIVATAPMFNTVSAATNTPGKVEILEVNKISSARTSIDGMQQDEITVKFTDPPTTGDYYILQLKPVEQISDESNPDYEPFICVNVNDPSVESIDNEPAGPTECLDGDAVFVNDVLFNGKTKELRLYVDNVYTQPVRQMDGSMRYATINLIHVTEQGYRYMRTYKYATENSGNPFSEPTNVYTNIKNGYGIFSMMSTSTKEVK